MRLPNAPPGLLHHPVPGSRGTTPAYIRTGMRFTVSLYCCAEYPCEGPGSDAVLPPALVGVALARQKVITYKPASSGRSSQLLGRGAGPRQQPQPHTAVDYFRLWYIGRIRHGIQGSLSVRER